MIVDTGLLDDKENSVFSADARNDLDDDDVEALVGQAVETVACEWGRRSLLKIMSRIINCSHLSTWKTNSLFTLLFIQSMIRIRIDTCRQLNKTEMKSQNGR